ncbi:hypothetical protein AOX56_00215 [Aeromonas sobria]|uniref:Uncharacterized protein n=2 Tax=Aeromonas sobria TaxID=646 RepID=A0A2N3J8T0_AERSO|nr:hypothetical protein AOX56_00215 [Aeromonas sobria]
MKPILASLFSSTDAPSKTDVIILEEDFFTNNGFTLIEKPGVTPANDNVNKLHRDIANLNYGSLGLCAEEIARGILIAEAEAEAEVPSDLRVKRFNEKMVIDIVKEAVSSGVVVVDKLKEPWKIKLGYVT